MVTPKILKFVDSSKPKKSKHIAEETFFFSSNKKKHLLYIKGYNIAKNSFLGGGCPFLWLRTNFFLNTKMNCIFRDFARAVLRVI